MKRSEAIKELSELLDEHTSTGSSCCNLALTEENLGKVLDGLIKLGMLPPKVAARVIRGEDYPFGVGCTMRCDCEDCNPNFGMTVWEQE